jgi:hypothetical protein
MRGNFTRDSLQKKLLAVFIGIFSEKAIGISSAKDFSERWTASVLLVKPVNCHSNEKTKSVNL